ncbi:hypothetical protein HHI36_008399 [Cryptolaemus montrouzieri]|uniref:Uncharacterized protein n=1 Tax=Cryptolaemus montrouzieri TaxID=559131 RepID=A0ABD2MSQ7_9CUCU
MADSEVEDVVTSFDSDLDPIILLSSDEDVSNNNDISDQDMKRKGSSCKISNEKRRFRKTCSDEDQMTKIPKMDANSMNQTCPSRFVSEFDITEEEENSIGVPSFSSQLQLSEPIEEEFPGRHPTFSQPLQYSETNVDIQQEIDKFSKSKLDNLLGKILLVIMIILIIPLMLDMHYEVER